MPRKLLRYSLSALAAVEVNKRSGAMLVLRYLWIPAAILVSTANGFAAETNFWCSPTTGLCGCDINVQTDCGLLRKNCKDGKFTVCIGTKCYCVMGVATRAIGTPPKILPKGVREISPSLRREGLPAQQLSR